MNSVCDSFETELLSSALELGLELSSEQTEKLLKFLDQLGRWNRTYNLTAIRDPQQMLVHHVVDSLSVVPLLDQTLYKNTVSMQSTGSPTQSKQSTDLPPALKDMSPPGLAAHRADTAADDELSRRPGVPLVNSTVPIVVDVGSGGGLPGIVLAIMRPWQIHCIDAVEKKTAFVRQMAGVLSLPNLHAHHARVESMTSLQADVVVSRAFASLADFARLAGHHASQTGCLLAMKGRMPHEEITELRAQSEWEVHDTHTLIVPGLDAQRCALALLRRES